MSLHKKTVLIIGGGPAGLTLAYELLSRSDEFDVTIIEKQDIIGGLAQTYNHKGNRIDIGGHRFFSKSQRVMDRWFDKMPLQGEEASDYKELGMHYETKEGGPDPDKEDTVMIARRRLSRLFWNGKFFDYPLSITLDTMRKFGFVDLVLSGWSYFISRFKTFDQTTLDGFFKARFGERLYQRFFHTYTRKVRGKRPFDISASWGAQRIKKLDLGKAVWDYFKKMIIGNKQSTETETSLIGKFYYPKLGPGQMREVVSEKVKDMGGKLVLGAGFEGGVLGEKAMIAEYHEGKINSVGAMLITEQGKILLQLRDSKAPTFPGKLATFGGQVEEGETIFQGLQRELSEELELTITEANVKYLGYTIARVGEREEIDHIYHVFGFDGQKLVLHEGERIMELKIPEAVMHEKTSDIAKKNIEYFVEKMNGKHTRSFIGKGTGNRKCTGPEAEQETGNGKIEGIIGDYKAFFNQIIKNIKESGIDTSNMVADHVSLRTSTMEMYELRKKQLLPFGYFLIEDNPINGRPITTVRLHKPLEGAGLTIDVLEISAPKPGKTYPDALDHVEFVTSVDLREMIRLYPDVEFELKALSNDVNSAIEVNFPDGTLVKFHNDTLRNVIALERKEYLDEFNKTRTFEGLQTERLQLKYIQESDIQDVFDNFDADVAEFMSPQATGNIQDIQNFIEKCIGENKHKTNLQLTARDKATGDFVGLVGIHHLEVPTPEIGIWIAKSKWSQGYGKEMLSALIQRAEQHLNYHYLYYPLYDGNIKSQKLVESLGGIQYDNSKTKKNAHGKEFTALEYKILHPKHKEVEGKNMIDVENEIIIEKARSDDAEVIDFVRSESWVETYTNEKLGITSDMIRNRFATRKQKNIEFIRKYIEEGNVIWVAKSKGNIIGIKYPQLIENDLYQLGLIYILKEFTGKGIGKELMEMSLKDDWDTDLYCEVVDYNIDTIRFYQKFGFDVDQTKQGKGIVFESGVRMNTVIMKRPAGKYHNTKSGQPKGNCLKMNEVTYEKGEGKVITVQPDLVVSTMPIKDLMNNLKGADPEVVRLSNTLEYRDFITVGILAKKLLVKNESDYPTINNIIPDNRLYIHDEGTTVGRIQIFNNWSPYLVKDKDTIWIGLEYFCNKEEEIRSWSDEKMIDFAISELEKMKLLDRADYLDGVVRRMEYTYPCYFGEGYEKFSLIRNHLDSIENLYCIGRNGAHRYNNQDHSMLSAMRLADMLISDNGGQITDNNGVDRNELWNINTEEEYQEDAK